MDKGCKGCNYKNEIRRLNNDFLKIRKLVEQLKLTLHTQSKRGLLNIIGSVSKSLFGTLDEDDLTLINKNIDKLFDSNNNMKIIIANQSALIKQVLNDERLQTVSAVNNDLEDLTNTVHKDEILGSLLIHTEFLISELHININEIIETIILGKRGIINPQFVKANQFLTTLKQITDKNFLTNHITPETANFQTLLDISSLKISVRNNKLLYFIRVPLLENTAWKIIKIYPIPIQKNKIFLAPVIEEPIVFSSEDQYLPVDEAYMNKYCKKTAKLQICKFTHPSYSKTGMKECELELMDHSVSPKNCNYVIFKINVLTFIPLETENNYLVIPEHEVQLDALCGTSRSLTIKEPSQLSSDESCTLTYTNNLMKIGGSDHTASYETKYKEFDNFDNDTIVELNLISEQLSTASKMSPNFNAYKMSLQQINSQINQVKTERRIKTLKDTGLSILQILGYLSIGSIGLYVLYKCKCWQFLSKCAPHTLCINILSSTANPVVTQHHSSEFNTPGSPTNEFDQPHLTPPEFEDLVDIKPIRRSVRFVSRRNII